MNARLGNILYGVGLIGAAISIFYAVVTVWVYRSGESLVVISGGFVTLEDMLSAVAIGMALALLSWGAGVAARLFWDTEVRIFLPRAEENVTPDEAEQEKEPKRGQKQSILILEDDPDFCSFVVGALERLGYRVLEAADANAAMRILEQEAGSKTGRVDLLLSDVELPGGVSGPECAIKAKVLYPQLKVVFMSSNTAGYPIQDKIPGFEEMLLTKPFRLNNLAGAMHHALAA